MNLVNVSYVFDKEQMSNSNISDNFQVPEMNDTWTEKKWEENPYIIIKCMDTWKAYNKWNALPKKYEMSSTTNL